MFTDRNAEVSVITIEDKRIDTIVRVERPIFAEICFEQR